MKSHCQVQDRHIYHSIMTRVSCCDRFTRTLHVGGMGLIPVSLCDSLTHSPPVANSRGPLANFSELGEILREERQSSKLSNLVSSPLHSSPLLMHQDRLCQPKTPLRLPALRLAYEFALRGLKQRPTQRVTAQQLNLPTSRQQHVWYTGYGSLVSSDCR